MLECEFDEIFDVPGEEGDEEGEYEGNSVYAEIEKEGWGVVLMFDLLHEIWTETLDGDGSCEEEDGNESATCSWCCSRCGGWLGRRPKHAKDNYPSHYNPAYPQFLRPNLLSSVILPTLLSFSLSLSCFLSIILHSGAERSHQNHRNQRASVDNDEGCIIGSDECWDQTDVSEDIADWNLSQFDQRHIKVEFLIFDDEKP